MTASATINKIHVTGSDFEIKKENTYAHIIIIIIIVYILLL